MTIDTLVDQKNQPMPVHKLESEATTEIAISARYVGKMYLLYVDFRSWLKQSLWYALPKFLRGRPSEFYQEFWALRDISFWVMKK